MTINNEWTEEHEHILIELADKAMCFSWLHSHSNIYYYSLNTWYTIPVIIISTLTGTANFAQSQVPIQYQKTFGMIIGGFNLLAGIISTIQQFLKITQLSESHRIASIGWEKYYRNIKIEIAKEPSNRNNFDQFIKSSKEDFDHLMETSPIIPNNIIAKFKKNFRDDSSFVKPEICDSLISTKLSRNPWHNKNLDLPIKKINTYDLQIAKNTENIFHDSKLNEIVIGDIEMNTQIDNMV